MSPLLAAVAIVSLTHSAMARTTALTNTAAETPVYQPDIANPIYYDLKPSTDSVDALQLESMTPEQLLRLFMDLHTAMEFEDAAAVARLLIERLPTHPVGYYNLACALSRLRHVDAAVDALEQSVHYGWRNPRHMRLDADLDGVRHDERFDEVMSHLNRMIHIERMAAAPLRRDADDAIVTDIQELAPELMARYQVPGMSVALVRGGEVIWSGAFGNNGTAVDSGAPVRLSAPRELLAVLAAQQLAANGSLPLETLLRDVAAVRREAEMIERPPTTAIRTVGWQMPSSSPAPEAGRDPYRGRASASMIDSSVTRD